MIWGMGLVVAATAKRREWDLWVWHTPTLKLGSVNLHEDKVCKRTRVDVKVPHYLALPEMDVDSFWG